MQLTFNGVLEGITSTNRIRFKIIIIVYYLRNRRLYLNVKLLVVDIISHCKATRQQAKHTTEHASQYYYFIFNEILTQKSLYKKNIIIIIDLNSGIRICDNTVHK